MTSLKAPPRVRRRKAAPTTAPRAPSPPSEPPSWSPPNSILSLSIASLAPQVKIATVIGSVNNDDSNGADTVTVRCLMERLGGNRISTAKVM